MYSASCLRCSGQELTQLPDLTDEIKFFECPSCHRQYAQKPGAALTYRWLHPISIALYEFSFRTEPNGGFAPRAASSVTKGRSAEEIDRVAREIEIELKDPTQQVRDILGTKASEEACREFLTSVVTLLKSPVRE
jgi:hypothetical protein